MSRYGAAVKPGGVIPGALFGHAMSKPNSFFTEPTEFPLVQGGPLFRLLLRTGLLTPTMDLAGRRIVADLLRQVHEHIGLVAHGADDHDDLVTILLGANSAPGRDTNLFRIGDTGAAEFLND